MLGKALERHFGFNLLVGKLKKALESYSDCRFAWVPYKACMPKSYAILLVTGACLGNDFDPGQCFYVFLRVLTQGQTSVIYLRVAGARVACKRA